MFGLERLSTGNVHALEEKIGERDMFCLYMWMAFRRMPLVNNDVYLKLARTDFNNCQVLHQLECHGLQMYEFIFYYHESHFSKINFYFT